MSRLAKKNVFLSVVDPEFWNGEGLESPKSQGAVGIERCRSFLAIERSRQP